MSDENHTILDVGGVRFNFGNDILRLSFSEGVFPQGRIALKDATIVPEATPAPSRRTASANVLVELAPVPIATALKSNCGARRLENRSTALKYCRRDPTPTLLRAILHIVSSRTLGDRGGKARSNFRCNRLDVLIDRVSGNLHEIVNYTRSISSRSGTSISATVSDSPVPLPLEVSTSSSSRFSTMVTDTMASSSSIFITRTPIAARP